MSDNNNAKMVAFVISAKPWKMVDEVTGVPRAGTSIEYIVTNDLNPTKDDDGLLGYKVAQQSADTSVSFPVAPAFYELELGVKMVKSKPQLYVAGAEPLGGFELSNRRGEE